jgi:hypothetical protein
MTVDEAAMVRLLDLTSEAIAAQDLPVGDQLEAAMREGRTRWRVVDHEGMPHVEVIVDGYPVCRVDVRRLLSNGS